MMGLQNPVRLTRRDVGDELTVPLDLNVTGRPLDQRGAREGLHVELANRHIGSCSEPSCGGVWFLAAWEAPREKGKWIPSLESKSFVEGKKSEIAQDTKDEMEKKRSESSRKVWNPVVYGFCSEVLSRKRKTLHSYARGCASREQPAGGHWGSLR